MILFDTCAMFWTADRAPISAEAENAIAEAGQRDEPILLSAISAWEVGQLASRGRLALTMSPQRWFEEMLRASQLQLVDLSPSALISSSLLPGNPPRDPADRIIIATARELDHTIMTRDRWILEYAKAGHVRALAC